MQLRIEPGCALGPFQLGSTINDVISTIKRDSIALRDNRLIFNHSDPLSADLIVDVLHLSIRLRFAADTQRLYLIDAYSPTQLTLSYLHTSFSGPSHPAPSLSSIYQTFGPSFPPQFDPKRQAWLLKYPGVAFVFDDHTAANTGVVQVMSDGELSYDDMDDRDVSLTRILVLHGEQFTPPPPSLLPSAASASSLSSSHSVHAHINRGLYLASRSLWLPFHHSIQDVLLDLGPPDSITWKNDEKMRIHDHHNHQHPTIQQQHTTTIHTANTTNTNHHTTPHHPHSSSNGGGLGDSFFFNYYGLGLDLLMEGRQGRVVKFVLHGNWMGSREFAQYSKCDYMLLIPHSATSAAPHCTAPSSDVGSGGSGSGGGGALVPLACVGCNARWSDVQRLLMECGCEVSRGMLNGAGGGEKGTPRSPFGGTMYYAARGVLFEVLKVGYLQTVTLFYEPALEDASR